MNNRLYGIIGLVGGGVLVLDPLRNWQNGNGPTNPLTLDMINEIVYALWSVGALAVLWAILVNGWQGQRPWQRFAAMLIGSLPNIIGVTTPGSNLFFWVAWPGLLLGMLWSGIATLVAGRWAGWHKFTVLRFFVSMLLFLAPVRLAGDFLGFVPWLLMGYAVFTPPEPTVSSPLSRAVGVA
jgi:hypothetical protein